MSQQMNESGYDYQATYTSSGGREPSFEYGDRLGDVVGQPAEQSHPGRQPSPGQRLTLAIVSLIALMFMTLIATGFLTNSGHTISWPVFVLLGLLVGLLCITVMVINVVFNMKH